ncbi:MAG: prolipoprotein diacylglyceryl transferase [Actinomycetes bacterium]|jgi:phosphatidylglycerol:prolipoprotein diacylglycerol transferase|nr:prolipoprotein diacylglyceryl transferase [Actinomycetes bacterium]
MADFLTAFQHVDPVALRIGSLAIRWYGLAYLAGFVGAWLLLRYFVRRWNLPVSSDDQTTIMFCVVLGVFLGGRLGYCLFYEPGYYLRNPLEIIAFWHGGISGMSFHGGFLGIVAGGAVASRLIKLPLLTLADLGSIGAPIGFGLGRLANFINGELWGRVSDLPWAIVFEAAGPARRHPSQLYEALLEGALLLVVMIALARKLPPRPRGELFGWLSLLYGAFRIFSEFFRQPDVQLGFIGGNWLTMGMLLSLPMVVGGVSLICWARRKPKPE